jgi:hypothetical protein
MTQHQKIEKISLSHTLKSQVKIVLDRFQLEFGHLVKFQN